MDPQEKWLWAKMSSWRRWMRGRESGNGLLALLTSPLLFYLPPPLQRPTLKAARVAMAPGPINIISVINIKSILLCFASGTEPSLTRRPCPNRLPFPSFFPTPPFLAIYQDHNLLWWVFKVLFCQSQSVLSNKWSQWSAGGLDTVSLFPSLLLSDTHGKIHFWKFSIYCFCLSPQEKKREGGGKKKLKKTTWLQGQTGGRVKLDNLCCLLSPPAPPNSPSGWGNKQASLWPELDMTVSLIGPLN